MNRFTLMILCAAGIPAGAMAQSAMDGYQFSQNDLKGTARFMSMGGAFGALGGDLSVISQNPGGIGVYRNSEIGLTFDLDAQKSTTDAYGLKTGVDNTNFLVNNIGGVATLRLANPSGLRNLNFGFTYQKAASLNRKYKGSFNNLNNSMSNYVAGVTNTGGATVADLTTTSSYDPYNPDDGGWVAPWLSVLGYDSYLISPTGDPEKPKWVGQWGDGTKGNGYFDVEESGSVDEYNVSFGGNVNNVLFWGMDFGIVDFNYTQNSLWGENLDNAYVDTDGALTRMSADWSLYNHYAVSGNGFNYKLGFIVKPIQELRLGFAFHTPTWYNINETFYGDVEYNYGAGATTGNAQSNNGYDGYNSYNFRTPWKLLFSAAGVVGNSLILSADYEWEPMSGMRFSDANWDGYSYGMNDAFYDTNEDIKSIYRSTNTFRVGAEYRVTPQFSLRAGFANVSSPVKTEVKNGAVNMYPAGTNPSYTLGNTTTYITCGLGYRYQRFSIDLAYVYKHRTSDFYAYPPDTKVGLSSVPTATLTTNHSQVVLSASVRL